MDRISHENLDKMMIILLNLSIRYGFPLKIRVEDFFLDVQKLILTEENPSMNIYKWMEKIEWQTQEVRSQM